MAPADAPDKVSSYFRSQWRILLVVTITGMIYNVGLLLGPIFEGSLAQCLLDISKGDKGFPTMLVLCLAYIISLLVVQLCRYLKRLYVRRFANNVNRSMKSILYANLVHKSKRELESEDSGSLMTKAISDVDQCAEGLRKFTTEVFDTGIAVLCYSALLFTLSWKLALISIACSLVSYIIADSLKSTVERTGRLYRQQSGRLNSTVLERVSNAQTYRVTGTEECVDSVCEKSFSSYEKSAIRANVLVSALPPLYRIISLASVIAIVYLGSKNVTSGQWTVASFTMFLSSSTKLAIKASKAAKLFNSVQKASVSWQRVKPFLRRPEEKEEVLTMSPNELEVENLSFSYDNGAPLFSNLSFTAKPGTIIGVTGPVACGKSTFGKVFLCELPYGGSIRFGSKELGEHVNAIVSYLGHDAELQSASIEESITMGKDGEVEEYLKAVCLDKEVSEMPEGVKTRIGSGGIRLSGGQAQRLALARTLYHRKPVIVLDDPFSALDRQTEKLVFENVKSLCKDSIVILISHRLEIFPELDNVIWMEDGKAVFSDHESLSVNCEEYRNLYELQKGDMV